MEFLPSTAAVVLAVVLLAPFATAQPEYKVGVSPLVLDLGTVERGARVPATFYVISSSPEALLVRLEASRGPPSFFEKPGYGHLLPTYSEEDASSWLSFFDNPVLLEPQDNPAPGQPRGVRPVTFYLLVPADAEPGVHTVAITPSPSTPQAYGGGANIISTVALTTLFTIPGKAVRQGTILDIIPGGRVEGQTELNIFFQNTGTVTINPRADSVQIFEGGQPVAVTVSTMDYVQPGEMKALKAYATLPGNDYDVHAEASYLTGNVVKDAGISIAAPRAAPFIPAAEVGATGFPLWTLAIPFLLLVFFWRRRRRQ